jgi:hypothetical protein
MRYLLILRRVLFLLLLGAAWLWTVAGAAFCPLLPMALRPVAALLCVIVPVWTWRRSKTQRWRPAGLIIVFMAVAGLLLLTRPQIDRPWEADQQQLPRVEITGQHVLIHHVRDIQKTTDSHVDYYNLAFSLNQLSNVWFGVELLGGSHLVAHTFLAFSIDRDHGREYFNISIEIRREQGETFSLPGGLYRNFELMYVFASERDILFRRAMEEDDLIMLFPIRATPEIVQRLFLDIAARANRLQSEPEFYHTLTNNCTNNIGAHVNRIAAHTLNPLDPRMLFPGLADTLLFGQGLLDSDLDLKSARRRFRVDQRIKENFEREDLSDWIRRFQE